MKNLLLFFIFSVLCQIFPQDLIAQNAQFDVRLVHLGTDCISDKVSVRIEIRAKSATSGFNIGSANFRFNYDGIQLGTPTIKNRDNLSIASDMNYANQSLSFTTSIVTVNIQYQGVTPKAITTDWLPVTTLEFPLQPLASCYKLTWRDNIGLFPQTVVYEVDKDNTEALISAEGGFFDVNKCTNTDPAVASLALSVPQVTLGQVATLSVTFLSGQPATFSINDGEDTLSYQNVVTNPMDLIVNPTKTTTYTLQNLSNDCGVGQVNGTPQVLRVNNVFVPNGTLTSVTATQSPNCSNITVKAKTSGIFGAGNSFTVFLSDSSGANFTQVSTGSDSTQTFAVPSGTPPGTGYLIRMVSNDPVSQVVSAPFEIKTPATATLTGTQGITAGNSTSLMISFTGSGPFSGQLSNGQTFSNITGSSTMVNVTPTTSTNYTLTSFAGACGAGSSSGNANVTVVAPVNNTNCVATCGVVTLAVSKK